MTLLVLLVLVIASVMAGYYAPRLPGPGPWIVAGIIVVVWLLVLIMVSGVDGGLLNRPLT